MTHHDHTVKKVCKCENCGNEAEMEIACNLEETRDAVPQSNSGVENTSRDVSPGTGKKVRGTATCSHCGSEADMWIDY